MNCKTCGARLASNWEELVKDINNPQCGFCDGTMEELMIEQFADSIVGYRMEGDN